MKTSAAYLKDTTKPLVFSESIETPVLREGQVLVELAYSGVCHSQLMEARGHRGEDKYLPHMLGHEGSGVVVEVGPGVKKVKSGDKVVLGWIKGEGINAPGAVYNSDSEKINAGGVTTFQKHSVVSENRVVKLDKGIPMDIAVLFGCAIPTGAGIVINTIKPKPKSTIAIWGLGGIGLSALLATKNFECEKIIAIDIENEKLELATEFGATHSINCKDADPLAEIYKITEGQGVDYVVESAGKVETIEQAFKSVKNNGGRCVFASHPKSGDKIKIDPFDLICGKKIEGSWGGNSFPDKDVPIYCDLYLKNKVSFEKLLSKTYKLSEINEALEDLETRKIVRALVEINSSITNS